ncbi:hypothetical protein IFU01_18130 [Oxalobacteraceae sp. CFBP 8763]|nr:hypothetical protein [Oxalobacteraceae sp. CFBP 8763]
MGADECMLRTRHWRFHRQIQRDEGRWQRGGKTERAVKGRMVSTINLIAVSIDKDHLVAAFGTDQHCGMLLHHRRSTGDAQGKDEPDQDETYGEQ